VLVNSRPTSHPLDREIGLFWNSLVNGEVVGSPLTASDAGVRKQNPSEETTKNHQPGFCSGTASNIER
ncbi:MAG: hypothetical protein ACE5FD_15150, partial [Anaerolineae bacterium]